MLFLCLDCVEIKLTSLTRWSDGITDSRQSGWVEDLLRLHQFKRLKCASWVQTVCLVLRLGTSTAVCTERPTAPDRGQDSLHTHSTRTHTSHGHGVAWRQSHISNNKGLVGLSLQIKTHSSDCTLKWFYFEATKVDTEVLPLLLSALSPTWQPDLCGGFSWGSSVYALCL